MEGRLVEQVLEWTLRSLSLLVLSWPSQPQQKESAKKARPLNWETPTQVGQACHGADRGTVWTAGWRRRHGHTQLPPHPQPDSPQGSDVPRQAEDCECLWVIWLTSRQKDLKIQTMGTSQPKELKQPSAATLTASVPHRWPGPPISHSQSSHFKKLSNTNLHSNYRSSTRNSQSLHLESQLTTASLSPYHLLSTYTPNIWVTATITSSTLQQFTTYFLRTTTLSYTTTVHMAKSGIW